MKNITLSLDNKLLVAGREYAKSRGMSLNALIRKLLAQTVESPNDDWMLECFELMDRQMVSSKGKKWRREDLYDV
ncbi:MAG: hypothetical protein IT291_09810 [Deltaproteobacteria bacterium]|nr:hypothetical protein [Deltaproteobacteria bacterium]